MEKEMEKSAVVLQDDELRGAVAISDDVIAMIASLAACEIEGVCGMSGNITNELMSKVGVKSLTKGVRVLVAEGEVKIDMVLNMEYGFNIPATCQTVQNKVKNTVENMTGLTCNEVNVRVAGIDVKK